MHEVLTNVKNKENGAVSSLNPSKATSEELRAYMAEVLPDFDRERVYPSDIKKLLSWYNLLINAGVTEFTPIEIKAQPVEVAEETTEEAITEVIYVSYLRMLNTLLRPPNQHSYEA